MIEKTIIDYLMGALDVEVYAERPENAPTSFIVVEKTGSTKENKITTATVAIQSHAPTLLEASQLDDKVVDAMDEMPEHCDVYSAKLVADYNFTDTTMKKYRYQAVYNINF